jgi:hypothetical protein
MIVRFILPYPLEPFPGAAKPIEIAPVAFFSPDDLLYRLLIMALPQPLSIGIGARRASGFQSGNIAPVHIPSSALVTAVPSRQQWQLLLESAFRKEIPP